MVVDLYNSTIITINDKLIIKFDQNLFDPYKNRTDNVIFCLVMNERYPDGFADSLRCLTGNFHILDWGNNICVMELNSTYHSGTSKNSITVKNAIMVFISTLLDHKAAKKGDKFEGISIKRTVENIEKLLTNNSENKLNIPCILKDLDEKRELMLSYKQITLKAKESEKNKEDIFKDIIKSAVENFYI